MYISIGFLLITLHMTSIIIVRGPIVILRKCRNVMQICVTLRNFTLNLS